MSGMRPKFDSQSGDPAPPSDYEHSPAHDEKKQKKSRAYNEGAKMAEESLREAFDNGTANQKGDGES